MDLNERLVFEAVPEDAVQVDYFLFEEYGAPEVGVVSVEA